MLRGWILSIHLRRMSIKGSHFFFFLSSSVENSALFHFLIWHCCALNAVTSHQRAAKNARLSSTLRNCGLWFNTVHTPFDERGVDSVTVNMGFPRWSIGVERRLMNQLWRGRGGGVGWESFSNWQKVCRESARLHAVEASRLWSVILDGG